MPQLAHPGKGTSSIRTTPIAGLDEYTRLALDQSMRSFLSFPFLSFPFLPIVLETASDLLDAVNQ